MNRTVFRVRMMSGGVSHSLSLLLAMGLGLNACGPNLSSEHAEVKGSGGLTQSYQDWCAGWELNCPVAEPDKTDPLTAEQFKALGSLMRGVLSSSSVFSISRQELDAANLQQAVSALHLDDVFQDVQERLDASQWQSIGMEKASLVSRQAVGSQLKTDAGLMWSLEPVQTVAVNAEGVHFSGFGLSSETAEESIGLKSAAISGDSRFSLALSDRTVEGVPQDFALDSLLYTLGLDTAKLEGKKIGLPELIAAGAPLVQWLNQETRQIALDRPFFAAAGQDLAVLLPDNGMGKALGELLSRLEKMRSSSSSGSSLASVSLVRGGSAKCDMNNGEVKMKFASEFGIKRIYKPNASSLGIEFYGLEASARKALGIGIQLKRVELTADKLTILDVPIIGKVEMKLDELTNPDQKTTLVCGP